MITDMPEGHHDFTDFNLIKLRLADFGNAVTLHELEDFHGEIQALLYRAPEVVLGLQGLGPGLDMWSAGLVLAEVGASSYYYSV